MGTTSDEGPVIAGLQLKWREFRAPRPGEDGAFGLWVVNNDLTSLLDFITQDDLGQKRMRMPYFAIVWPSAESLIERLLTGPPLKGKQVLDLGCGLGACGFAAAYLGAQVTFLDWEPNAIEIATASATEQPGQPKLDFVIADWRKPPRIGRFDLILGADLLYEQTSSSAVASFLARHLKPGAEAWITDPGRRHASEFVGLALDEGVELVGTEFLPAAGQRAHVTLFRLRRPQLGPSQEWGGRRAKR